ncbi:MAG: G1 family glutamic endopeptidase [Phycisphaerae bacterium]
MFALLEMYPMSNGGLRRMAMGGAICAGVLGAASATTLLANIPISYSSNWSGYADLANSGTQFTSVKGSWTVPTVVASPYASASYSAFWVGLDGANSGTVEQLGIAANFINGSPQYFSWYEMYPNNSYGTNMTINPGDNMTASVTYTGTSSNGTLDDFTLAMTDNTNQQTFSINTTATAGADKRSSAEWIAEAPYNGAVLPLADFGSVTFTGASATLSTSSGTETGAINASYWSPQQDNLVSGYSPGISAAPSSLTAGGSAFTVTVSGVTPPPKNYVLNGNFTANASFYTTNYGYDHTSTTGSSNTNPTAPTSWTPIIPPGGGGVGVNGSGTSFTDFGPSSAGSATYAFMQGATNGISQLILSLTVGQTYKVSYEDAARSGDTAVDLTASVTDSSGNTLGSLVTTNLSDVSFSAENFTFTADATTATLEFLNTSGAGDLTADVTAVSITAVPEPASVGLLALGGLGLLLVPRKRA